MKPLRYLSFAMLAMLLAACTKPRASRALEVAFVSTQRASAAFVEWDKAHQLAIVDTATSKEEGRRALAAYRAKRQHVLDAFTAAYASMATVASALAVTEAGSDAVGLPARVLALARDVYALHQAIAALRSP